jgi:integrase
MHSKKLKALQVDRVSKSPGIYYDGAGLMLVVSSKSASSWVFRYQLGGKRRDMGLGSYPSVTLEHARAKADDARKRVKAERKDPIDAAHLEAAMRITFKECAESFIATNKAGWKNATHAAQWPTTLETFAYPSLGSLPVGSINTALVTKVLDPIWNTKTETASRLRQRIEAILDFATVKEYRTGPNPAKWRGHLDRIYQSRSDLKAIRHHPSLPYDEVAALMADLKKDPGVGTAALEFIILTAARTGEALDATWPEIDLTTALWTIPAARMKGGREHRVPLSAPALAILRKQYEATSGSGRVFPGAKPGKRLSKTALPAVMKRIGRHDVTIHGFRSSFRVWAAEQTTFPREVCEQCLAHSLLDKIEAAYQRSDLFEKRRKLMGAWASFCTATPGASKVIPIRQGTRRG